MRIEISDTGSPAPYRLAPADEVVIRLPENPTTGYRWELSQSGAGELGLVEDRFLAGESGTAPGAAGHRLFVFHARRAGEVRLQAALRRAWDPPEASLQDRVFTVVVG